MGYTLVELLVVLAITAMLLSIVLPRFVRSTDAAKTRAREQNMAVLRDAIDQFKSDRGAYPAELRELVGAKYLRAVPVDPVTGSTGWTALPDPRGAERGIWDIAPPQEPAGKSHAETRE